MLNYDYVADKIFVEQQFQKGQGRGPESSCLTTPDLETVFGFHRLAINGLNAAANQPLILDQVVLICNGEIYNYKQLYGMMKDARPTTESDCEVILHLFVRYGIDYTLSVLDGVFAFALLDRRGLDSRLYVARDPYGVRPMYQWIDQKHNRLGFASELKMLSEFARGGGGTVAQFPPGYKSVFLLQHLAQSTWFMEEPASPFALPAFTLPLPNFALPAFTLPTFAFASDFALEHVFQGIRDHFFDAVYKRCSTTERPVACLLSGGLDSSAVTAVVCQFRKQHGLPPVETYSIGMAGSQDLVFARQVADYLGTDHHEVLVTEQDFIDAVPYVVRAIESYDTTTVRASLGNWLLGKYIREHSEAKVIFNGDGSDELMGGYLYMRQAPDALEFDRECRRLLRDIHAFDVLRSDKCISCHGLEPRTPFLDRGWVQFYLSLPATMRFKPQGAGSGNEKFLFRSAMQAAKVLPEAVLWRRKEAFSDGVSGTTRSLFQILQESQDQRDRPLLQESQGQHMTPTTLEQSWYRSIFEEAYPGCETVVPYFWMPRYVEAHDASARTLALYHDVV